MFFFKKIWRALFSCKAGFDEVYILRRVKAYVRPCQTSMIGYLQTCVTVENRQLFSLSNSNSCLKGS